MNSIRLACHQPQEHNNQPLLVPFEEAFYCEGCNKIMCPECTKPFVSLFYCPSCKFEIPPGMAREEHGKCPRGCTSCLNCNIFMTTQTLQQKSVQICPACSNQHSVGSQENESNAICHSNFQKLKQHFYKEPASISPIHLEPYQQLQPLASSERTTLRVRLGRSCFTCQSTLEACQMHGTTFKFPNSKLVSCTLIDIAIVLRVDNRILLQIRNPQISPLTVQTKETLQIELASSRDQKPFYEIDAIMTKWEQKQNSIILDKQENMCWLQMEQENEPLELQILNPDTLLSLTFE